jgi:ABC-2 type transport system permease protein
MLADVGVDFPIAEIAWSSSNPFPGLGHLPFEIPFSLEDNSEFSSNEVTSGLQLMVSIFPGHIAKAKDSWSEFTPLHSISGGNHGTVKWSDMVVNNPFMGTPQVGNPQQYQHKRTAVKGPLHLGAYVKGSKKEGDVEKKVDMIVISDIDFISNQFFGMRSQGSDLNFDNITMFLNSIDFLSGDKDFIELRKKRKKHHTLTKFDDLRKVQDTARTDIVKQAEASAELELGKARKAVQAAVENVRKQKDLKPEEMGRIIATVQEAQQQTLAVKEKEINRKKNRKIQDAEREMNEAMKSHKNRVVTMAVVIPVLLPMIIALFVFIRRKSRETKNVSRNRIRGGA